MAAPRRYIIGFLLLGMFTGAAGLIAYQANLFGLQSVAIIQRSLPATQAWQWNAGSFAYVLPFEDAGADNSQDPFASGLRLYEDGAPLGPAHALLNDVGTLGKGRYSHWDGRLIFSSSDNSDPRSNGRIYSTGYNLGSLVKFLFLEEGNLKKSNDGPIGWPIVRAGKPVRIAGLFGFGQDAQPQSFVQGFHREANFLSRTFNSALPYVANSDSLVFPVPALYLYQKGEMRKIVLAVNDDELVSADLVWGLVSTLANGGSDDVSEFRKHRVGSALSLLTAPEEKSWNCGPQSTSILHILSLLNIRARIHQWIGSPEINSCPSHQNIEIYLEEYGGWTLYDSHFGVVFRPGVTGRDVFNSLTKNGSTADLIRLLRQGSPQSRKTWKALAKYNLTIGVFERGQNGLILLDQPGVDVNDLIERGCINERGEVLDQQGYEDRLYSVGPPQRARIAA